MLPTGFAALGITTVAADRFKSIFIGLDYSAQRARRAATAMGECRLNRVNGAALDACRCPAADCGGPVTCTTNSGSSASTDNNGVWVVQNTTGLCPQPTTTGAPTTTPKPAFSQAAMRWSKIAGFSTVLATVGALHASVAWESVI